MNEAATVARPATDQLAGTVSGLEVRSIAKAYDRRAVLHDVSLDVHRGEVVGLLGPNGAGKTTCFYSVMGWIFLEPFGELVGHQAFERLADLGTDQFVLGLRAELGVGKLDRDDRGQAFAHVLAS